jgi:flagellar FliJ protein
MSGIGSLGTLLEHTERQRDAVLAQVQRAMQAVGSAVRQAEQLHEYRGQYDQRWQTQFRAQGAAEIVQCYQSFNERLSFAITQQEQAVEAARAQLDRLRALLQQQEIKVASIRKLIERRLAEQSLAASQRDQKQTDEMAARSARYGPQAAASSSWTPL